MADKIRVGHVGAGWMGTELLEKQVLHPDVEVVGLVETSDDRRENALNRFKLDPSIVVPDIDEMLKIDGIEAVVVSSPSQYHGEQSIKALEKGLHCFCEKPPATCFEDIVRQKELDDGDKNLVTFVDYILRFEDMSLKLHDLLLQKAFGNIIQIQINYRHAVNIAGDKKWKTDVEAVGMGPIHSINAILWHMQGEEVESVYATKMNPQGADFTVPPIYSIFIHFKSGVTGVVLSNVETPNGYDQSHDVFGSEGWFMFHPQAYADPENPYRSFKLRYKSNKLTDGKWLYPMNSELTPQDKLWPREMSFPDSGDVIHHKTRNAIDYFIDCIKDGRKGDFGFSADFMTQEVIYAALLSATIKENIKFPLDHAQVLEHEGRFLTI